MEKDFIVEVKIKNAYLYHKIYDKYKSIKELSEASGVNRTVIYSLLNFKWQEYVFKSDGTLTSPVIKLIKFLKLDENKLITENYLKVQKNKVTKEMDFKDINNVISMNETKALEYISEERDLQNIEDKNYLENLFKSCGALTEEQEKIIKLHYYEGKSLEELQEELGYSRQTVVAAITSGLKKLKNAAERLENPLAPEEIKNLPEEKFDWEEKEFPKARRVSQAVYFQTAKNRRRGAATEDGKAKVWLIGKGIQIPTNSRDLYKDKTFFNTDGKEIKYFYIKEKRNKREEKKEREKLRKLMELEEKRVASWESWKKKKEKRLNILDEYADFIKEEKLKKIVEKKREYMESAFNAFKGKEGSYPPYIKSIPEGYMDYMSIEIKGQVIAKMPEEERKNYIDFYSKICSLTAMEQRVLKEFYIDNKTIDQIEEELHNEQVWLYKKNALTRILSMEFYIKYLLDVI